MDKLVTDDWDKRFSRMDQRLVHSSDRYTEVSLTFEEPGLAAGSLSLVKTPGMALKQIAIRSERPLLFCDVSDTEDANSAFILSGGIESRFSNVKKPVDFRRERHGFQYNPSFQAEHIVHSGHFDAFQITYDLPFFRELIQSTETSTLDKVANSMDRREVFFASPDRFGVQPRMADIIQAIRTCTFQGFTRYLFIEAKLLELFALQVEHMAQASLQPATGQWSRVDREKLEAVREFIEANYLMPLTLAQLTQQFGLNEFKLKKGYKELFNTTVFGHIHHLRMKKARQLLAEKAMNVSETAYYIGYQNVGSFSAEFKKRFGYSPTGK
ncbi:hypothetical protein GCM10023189_35910 [Nibrella saemangeumensis]|uniref:HTH araC/xylS-type domain-containing protein n=1 Tax=Nibrella saemangeumensis TaxID=1084526 RepID=A0ABP8N6A4_9BACT